MKIVKLMILIATLTIASIVTIRVYGSSSNTNDHDLAKPRSVAVTTWTEQTFNEAFFGDGFWQLRRRFEADGRIPNTSLIHENRRFIGGGSNYSYVVNQEISYSVSERVGHEVSVTGQKRFKWLQIEVGYTFSYEKTTTRTTTGVIAPRKHLQIYESDVRVKQQWVWVDVYQQRATNIFATKWKDTGLSWFEDEVIREYNGNWVEFLEYSI